MKNITILVILLILGIAILSGCTEKGKLSEKDITKLVRQEPIIVSEEKIGGKYNASILEVQREYEGTKQTWKKIEYIKNNKTIRDDFVFPDIRTALDWIKLNIPEDAIIMGWWDYGRSIEGYTGREVVVETLSKEMLSTVSEYQKMSLQQKKDAEKKTEEIGVSHEKIKDVSKVLTTKSPQEAIRIMKKYNAGYLFIHGNNDIRIFSIFQFAIDGTWTESNNEEINKTIVGMASKGVDINGFELVYSDENVKLYKVL